MIPEAPPSAQLHGDGVYLIVGGLGGVGQSLIRWMSERGARHIVTLSRSDSPSTSAVALMEELRASGTDLLHMKCDVTSLDEVQAVLKRLHEQPSFGRVLGVINSAMVIKVRR
jgi:NAD(P)-dependent dehydrogenase (short-subunit alcohol dehydrogenase family)